MCCEAERSKVKGRRSVAAVPGRYAGREGHFTYTRRLNHFQCSAWHPVLMLDLIMTLAIVFCFIIVIIFIYICIRFSTFHLFFVFILL